MLGACYGPISSPPQVWVRLSVTINYSAKNEKSRLSWLATKHCNTLTIIQFYKLWSNFNKHHEFHKIYKKISNKNNDNNNNNNNMYYVYILIFMIIMKIIIAIMINNNNDK